MNEAMLRAVQWGPTGLTEADVVDGVPVATHQGVFKLGDIEMRCYRLSDGMAVFDADDVHKFFGDFLNA